MSASSNDPTFQPSGGQTTPTTSAETQELINGFWPKVSDDIKVMNTTDFKTQELPLARIKKIMKLDDDVKMISAEAPVLFAKAAEIFISELSMRAWTHTEDNKRRTLQRNDIAMAISKYDQFDFLIDIVPRDELKPTKRDDGIKTTSLMPEQIQYYFQVAQQQTQAAQQQQQQTVQQTNTQPQGNQPIQQFQIQTLNPASGAGGDAGTQSNAAQQVIQIQSPQQQQPVVQNVAQPQVLQQIVMPNGDIQNIPIQLTAQQLQAITAQIQNRQGQPIVIQTQQPTQQTQEVSTQQFAA